MPRTPKRSRTFDFCACTVSVRFVCSATFPSSHSAISQEALHFASVMGDLNPHFMEAWEHEVGTDFAACDARVAFVAIANSTVFLEKFACLQAWAKKEALLHLALRSYVMERFQRNKGARRPEISFHFMMARHNSACVYIYIYMYIHMHIHMTYSYTHHIMCRVTMMIPARLSERQESKF